jgi:hypothetical protein
MLQNFFFVTDEETKKLGGQLLQPGLIFVGKTGAYPCKAHILVNVLQGQTL